MHPRSYSETNRIALRAMELARALQPIDPINIPLGDTVYRVRPRLKRIRLDEYMDGRTGGLIIFSRPLEHTRCPKTSDEHPADVVYADHRPVIRRLIDVVSVVAVVTSRWSIAKGGRDEYCPS